MIEFRHVSKIYRQGQRQVTALNDLSLTIAPGEFVVVTGPSGSGKSSFLHLAGGLDVPTEGEAIVDGRDLRTLNEEELTLFRRNRIGLVFQFLNLMPTLSVLENTALPALLSGGRFADVRATAERLLTRVSPPVGLAATSLIFLGVAFMLPGILLHVAVRVRSLLRRLFHLEGFLAADNMIKFPQRTALTAVTLGGLWR